MFRIFRLSFSLKNTYRVNSTLYALKQLPLIKKLLPESLYGVRGLKIFANIVAAIWAFCSAFVGKILYFLILSAAVQLYRDVPNDALFLHQLLFLTAVGAFTNTSLFNPTKDKFYAVILLRMDARKFALTDYGYTLLSVLLGFLPCALIAGLPLGVPLWICLLLPFSVVCAKLFVAALALWDYDRNGRAYNENQLGKLRWLLMGLLLAAAYGLPALGITLPVAASAAVLLLVLPLGFLGARKIFTFKHYREVYQQLLAQSIHQMDNAAALSRQLSQKNISADTTITSRRRGFEYLNELFIKRHRKILWKSAVRVAAISLFLVLGAALGLYLVPEIRTEVNDLLLVFLPYFVFILYAVNRGTSFTTALFMNCDHSLLTYSFYKQPRMVLRLFAIRLREIIKINLLPASVIGAGLAVLLYCSGGTDNPIHYAVLVVSVLCMSIFFSVHYLTIYYLLQPYNAGTEMKSATYRLVLSGTYFVCFLMMQLRMPTLIFGALCIAFSILYCVVACILVYKFAPRTFRLRS